MPKMIKCRFFVLFMAVLFLFSIATRGQNDSATVQGDFAGQLVKDVASLIERGQWEQAEQRLSASSISGDKRLKELDAILDQYHQLLAGRAEKQTQVFKGKYEAYSKSAAMVEAADPNTNYPTTFSQLRDVWREATERQKKELTQTKAYRVLMDYAEKKANYYNQAGQWSKAWTKGAKWLVTFEPENTEYQKIEDLLRMGDAVQCMLEKDPCQSREDQYKQISRTAAYQAFAILSSRYVETVDFQKMRKNILERCEILTTVLKNDSVDFACQADASGYETWDQTIGQLANDAHSNGASSMDLKSFVDFFEAMLALNEKTLKLPEGAMVALMAEGAVSTLDPYTQIVWPYEIKNFEKDLTGQFGGIGIRIKKDNDRLVVTSLIAETPAMTSGLQPDDIIVAVDGELTADMSTTCAVQKISGPIGTSVTLSIQRPGQEKELLISLVRAKVVLPAVEGAQRADNGKSHGQWDYFLDKDSRIGYLRLNNFTDRTVGQLVQALDQLEEKGLGGLILDLRGNGGGLLAAAVDVSDLFISQGCMLSSKGRDNTVKEWKAKPDSHQRKYPIVVMIDEDSASSSEVVAGVLGANATDRAILVGSRSYGKGSVQEVVDLGQDIGQLKYTTAYYYLPDGERVKNRYQLERQGRNDWGITPDVDVPLFNFEVTKITEVSQERRRILNDKSPDPEKVSMNEQMLAADAQLATAVLVIKAKIAAAQ